MNPVHYIRHFMKKRYFIHVDFYTIFTYVGPYIYIYKSTIATCSLQFYFHELLHINRSENTVFYLWT